MPVLLDAQEAIGIPIFSSFLEIPENYRRKKAITECDFNYLFALIKAVKRKKFVLRPENKKLKDMLVDECYIQGVASHVIKAL